MRNKGRSKFCRRNKVLLVY